MDVLGVYGQVRGWLDRNPAIKWTVIIVNVALFVIGWPGIRDDIISWGVWLDGPAEFLGGGWAGAALDSGWQWGLVAVTGITLIAINVPTRVWNKAQRQTEGPSEEELASEQVKDESSSPPGHSLKTAIEEAEFQAANCMANHRIHEDSVEVALSFLDSPPSLTKITCVVLDPAGVHTSAEGRSFSLGIFIMNPDIKLSYPKDFPGGSRLRIGKYSVTWLSESTFTIVGGLFPFNRRHVIAQDAFIVG